MTDRFKNEFETITLEVKKYKLKQRKTLNKKNSQPRLCDVLNDNENIILKNRRYLIPTHGETYPEN